MLLYRILIHDATLLWALVWLLILILQAQITSLHKLHKQTNSRLRDLINLLYEYMREERNLCQDRLNQLNGTHACTSERMRKARKIEKIDEIIDKIKEYGKV